MPNDNKTLLRDCLQLLESFDYERDEDSQSKSFFKAHINEDWFFHVKHSIERELSACKVLPEKDGTCCCQQGQVCGMCDPIKKGSNAE